LGVVTSVCLKLWPLPERAVTVAVDDPARARASVYRPLAVLETQSGGFVYLQGTGAEVQAQATRLGGSVLEGLAWPESPSGEVCVSLRVPPALVGEAVRRLPPGPFVAQHGVGEISLAPTRVDADDLQALRTWAETEGGSLIRLAGRTPVGFDPWGSPPAGLQVQRRLMAAFDPARILNRGRMAGAA
jgi:FAD/FMN-containing dehydrogenase